MLEKQLALGLPASALLILTGWLAFRRTQAFVVESQQRQIAENALKQSQRLEALGQLTGGVAHDFNNLLMVVQGNADRLLRETLSERQQRATKSILQAAAHGEKLTRQLLAFSRTQPIKSSVVNLRDRLPQLEEMLSVSLKGNIDVVFDFTNDLGSIEVDPSDLDLAILNLALNAKDAMPDGGHLTIRALNDRDLDGTDRIGLSVSDTGNGIDPEIIPRVFDPFLQPRKSEKGQVLA